MVIYCFPKTDNKLIKIAQYWANVFARCSDLSKESKNTKHF